MHYRAMFTSSEFLTSADLYDERSDTFRELDVVIEKIKQVTLTGKKGKKDGRPGIFFKGSKTGKPLGVNATNAAAISNIAGSPDMKKWIGVTVRIGVDMVEIRGEGIRPAIRVRPFRADQQRAAAPPPAGSPPPSDLPPDDEELRAIAERDREESTR